MAKTKVSDVIVPAVFAPYALERKAALSKVIQCGAVQQDSEFDELASGPGKTIDMPFWKDLTATRQLLNDSTALVPNKISAPAWGANILTKWSSGDDPMARIRCQVDRRQRNP